MPEYRVFFVTYLGITDELNTAVSIIPICTTDIALRGIPVEIEALWDTGATDSCIKPALWERLKLYPIESGCRQVIGIGGNVTADLTIVNLRLIPGLEIAGCPGSYCACIALTEQKKSTKL